MTYNKKAYESIKKWRETNIEKYREYDKLRHRKSDIKKCIWLKISAEHRRISVSLFF